MTQERGKWREICEAIVKESDPAKMSELAAQLMAALDEQELGNAPSAKMMRSESSQRQSKSGSSGASARSTGG